MFPLLDNFKNQITTFYFATLPQPHASLVAGLTLGVKEGIPGYFWDSLVRSGTTHVVVASGMNVTLVGGFLLSVFLNFVKRKSAVFLTIIGIWFYALTVGLEAPIVRAAIMGSIAFLAQATGRLSLTIRALILSVLVMILVKPNYLWEISFWLSFVATLSLILFQKPIEGKILWLPRIFRDGLSTSLAAQIGVLPLLVYCFGYFNLLSPLINALVLWIVAPVTILGMIAGVMGIIIPSLGSVILYLTYPLTSWFIFIILL